MRNLIGLLSFVVLSGVVSAAPFQNLGFDDANTNNASPGIDGSLRGPTTEFLPGWTIFSGPQQQNKIGINVIQIGGGEATLFSSTLPGDRFSLDLFPATSFGAMTLSQTGEVPDGAKAIHFLAIGGHLELSMGGVNVPLVYVPRTPDEFALSDVYGDISAFAGQTVDLKITAPVPAPARYPDYGLDSLSFIVPEPSPMILWGWGGIGLIGFWKLKQRMRAIP